MARDILTTVIGSYPRPDWLGNAPTEQALTDAMMITLKTQELAGIDLLSGGDMNRFDVNHPETNGAIDYFIRPLQNVRTGVTRSEERKFQEVPGLRFRSRTAGVVEGQLGEGSLNLTRDYLRTRALTGQPLKFGITSPYMLGRVLIDKHYKDKESLVEALADLLAGQVREIEAEVVQVSDEFICGNPQDSTWAADSLNRVFDVVPHKSALHTCFGNYNGQTVQQGSYAALIEFINMLHIDHVLVEATRRAQDDLAALKDIRPDIGIGLGVIDVKSTVIETPDDVASAIERADKLLGPNRLKYISPDCGLWMLKRSIADAKLVSLVRGRDLFLADGGDEE